MTGQTAVSTPGIGGSTLTRSRPSAFSRTDVGSLHRDGEFCRQKGRGSFSLEQVKARLKPYEAGMPYHEPRPQTEPCSKDSPRSRWTLNANQRLLAGASWYRRDPRHSSH
jgi:hypothetical protein